MKTILNLLIVSILSGLFACNSEESKVQIPKNVLPIAKMERYLYDLHELEAKLQTSGIRQDTLSQLFPVLEKDLMKKHKTDTGMVKRSFRFYAKNIAMMDTIYTHLLKKAEK